ncbi:sulfatase-like hydrolase/transferase [Candidatus Poribacteria bacterium]|nr:sulfatase-like hydrolase/transferase [Candidatus Poribacteria bacterium]
MEINSIIIIIADSLRPDHLSCYDYERNTSPCIDILATESLVFRNAYSQSTWTRPVATSLLTGLYPGVHGVETPEDALSDNIVTLPNITNEFGFRSALFSTIEHVSHHVNLDKDFDDYFPLLWSEIGHKITACEVVEKFCSWLEKNKDFKIFAVLWFSDTHIPYNFPKDQVKFSKCSKEVSNIKLNHHRKKIESLNKSINNYDNSISYFDKNIGDIIEFLKDINRYSESLFFITSDHGEVFNDHGKFDFAPFLKHFFRNKYGILGHGGFPYEELIRIPLIMKLPEQQIVGNCNSLVECIDILTTISTLLGADLETQGISLLEVLNSDAKIHKRYILSESKMSKKHPKYYVLRNAQYKYFRCDKKNLNGNSIAKRFIYRLLPKDSLIFMTDINNEKDISSEKYIIDSMREKLDFIIQTNKELQDKLEIEKHNIIYSQEVKKRLKDLGYLE